MAKKKLWQDLTIADNFIFGKVLENDPATCKLLLETILGFKIDSIEYPEREKMMFLQKPLMGKKYLMLKFRPAIMIILQIE